MPTAPKKKVKPSSFITPLFDLQVDMRSGQYERVDTQNRVIQEAVEGRSIFFNGYRYETSDPEEIEFLRNHEFFNKPRGIWEEGNAPDEPKPTQKERVRQITRASAQGDIDALEALLTDEQEGHNRPEIVSAIEDALEAVEEAAPKAEAKASGTKTKKTAEAATEKDTDSGDQTESSD